MIQVALNSKHVPFFYGISVTEEIRQYKNSKPKKDPLKEFLKWKQDLKAEGIDCSDVTFEIWKQTQEEEEDTIKDTMMVYYLCYTAGCKFENQTPMTYEEFIVEVDKDYHNNLSNLSEALKEASGTQENIDQKN